MMQWGHGNHPRSPALPGNALPRGSASLQRPGCGVKDTDFRSASVEHSVRSASARQSLAESRSQAEPRNERWVRLAMPFLGLILVTSTVHAEDWYNWRGPEQSGVSREKNLPDKWSPT